MSFLDYLDDNRGQYIDHRSTPPSTPGRTIDDDTIVEGGGPGASRGSARRRRRSGRGAPDHARYRPVRPVFMKWPYSDPLPYEEPWERAER